MREEILSVMNRVTGIDKSLLIPESKLNELGITSIQVIELIVKIEMELGIEIPDEELDISKFSTVENFLEISNLR